MEVETVRVGLARRKVERIHLITANFNLAATIAHNKRRIEALEEEMLSLSTLPARVDADLALNKD